MLKKAVLITVFLILLLSPAFALCGNKKCEEDENTENCCLDCGCSFGEECKDNECVPQITFFSFGSEISIFLLALIIIIGGFVIGYGMNIVRKVHKRHKEHSESSPKDASNKEEEEESKREEVPPESEASKTPKNPKEKILLKIKKGKTVKEIKKELKSEGVDPSLVNKLLKKVIDSLIAKAEQGLLSVEWDPQIINQVFEEIMKKPDVEVKEKSLHYPEKPKRVDPATAVEKYIGIALARGYPIKRIKKKLMNVGWSKEKVDKLLRKVTD